MRRSNLFYINMTFHMLYGNHTFSKVTVQAFEKYRFKGALNPRARETLSTVDVQQVATRYRNDKFLLVDLGVSQSLIKFLDLKVDYDDLYRVSLLALPHTFVNEYLFCKNSHYTSCTPIMIQIFVKVLNVQSVMEKAFYN